MIAALFALAAAMVIGGCAAVIQGFPYVRLESGLAMVIAGSVAASSGAVLLGLGVVAAGLRRVERAAGSVLGVRTVEPAEASGTAQAASDGRPRLPPVLPAAPTFVLPPAPVLNPPSVQDAHRIEPGPRLDLGGFPHSEPPSPAEPELPIPGLTPAPSAPAPEAEAVAEPEPAAHRAPAEDDLFAAPEPPPPPEEAPALRPSLHAAPDPEPEPTPEPAPERKVVGRYASGGNTYVMFEDGVIEAETPQGRFTFASLDELKAFVDGGGETGARGAA